MKIGEVREGVRRAREGVLTGDTATAIDQLDRVLGELSPQHLLTSAEAAALLGVRSETIVRLWCRTGFLACVTQERGPLIPVSEVERVMESAEVRSIRRSDQLHDASAELGSEDGLDDDELLDLAAGRPGKLPWKA